MFAELFRDNVVRHVSGKVDSRFAKHFLIFSLSGQEKDSAAADKGAPVPSRSHQHHFLKVKNLASVIFFSGAPGEGSENSEIQINWNSSSMLLGVQEIDATQILLLEFLKLCRSD